MSLDELLRTEETIARLTEERDQARGYLAEIAAAIAEQSPLFVDADWRDEWSAAIAWLKKHIGMSPEASALEQYQEAINSWRTYARDAADRRRAAEQERDELRAACQAAAQWIGALDISYWDDSPLGELRDALGEES